MDSKVESFSERHRELYSFSKDKLPRGLSYPLKRSLLDNALGAASVCEVVCSVRYLGEQNGNTVLNAHFSPDRWLAKSLSESMVWRGFDHRVTFDRADEILLCTEQ